MSWHREGCSYGDLDLESVAQHDIAYKVSRHGPGVCLQ